MFWLLLVGSFYKKSATAIFTAAIPSNYFTHSFLYNCPPHLLPLTLIFLFVCFSLFYFDIHSTPKMITPHLSDFSLSLSVSHLCSRCMKGHDHRCHTHTHTMLKIMRLFWEYYNAGNNTDNDDDNSTMSVTIFDRTGWVFRACVLWKFWKSWSKKCDLCGKCELWSLCFFF